MGLRKAPTDFFGGTVDKNPPTNAGDTGSIPVPGRSHMPRATTTEPELQSLQAAATEAWVPRAHAPQQEKPHSEKLRTTTGE